ncbi:MAG: hypothetical protein OJF49_000053 [Ktedonobacterales bacterium]|jgi:translation initiation factor 2B subunit (eIF-2B alpha/beta/delta family)|nr:MAG: hypothetical protein OJF49_000053 [Ktedonobacterales bacterium]
MSTPKRLPNDNGATLPSALQDSIYRIRDDREHGASWLSREAARSMLEGAKSGSNVTAEQQLEQLHAVARAFVDIRPSMAALANTVARIWAATAHSEWSAYARLNALRSEAQRSYEAWDAASEAIYHHARPYLAGTLYTHSRSGTVEYVLTHVAADQYTIDGRRHIVVSESQPGGEGLATARALATAGWQVTLVADAACGLFLSDTQTVIIGADSVRADGSVINKVGTYPLALMAHQAHVPIYVLCETVKIAAPDFPLVYEEMPPEELLPQPIAGITPRNPYFDRTPPELITAIIAETGVLSDAKRTRLATEATYLLEILATE